MKTIILTETKLQHILGDKITYIKEGLYNEALISNITNYIKSFASGKGKLPSCDEPLQNFYNQHLYQAFEWASQKLDDVRRSGFAYFKSQFKNYIINHFTFNKRGLIYVERSIDFDIDKELGELSFSSIGECWSWRKNNSSSYCSNLGIMSNKIQVIICGYVHPASVDWLETTYLNSYDMKNETEIRMNNNAEVEVSYYRIGNEKFRLGGSYLINASADKYRKD